MTRTALALLLLAFPMATAAEEMHTGGHFQDHEEFRKVIDLRCTVCHTRERVEAARREGRDWESIRERMIERGAVLDERDKEVLGTFWGTPLKEGETPRGPKLPAH